MKRLLLVVLIISISFFSAFAQSLNDFIIIDELDEGYPKIKKKYHENKQVYQINEESVALEQISKAIRQTEIDELHIYTQTKPGEIIFKNLSITPDNVGSFSSDLETWSLNVFKSVVIHSDDVFDGDEGQLLREKLEETAGLLFETQ